MVRAQRALRALPHVVAVLSVLGFAITSVGRVAYPFELEWMEGGALDHVRWMLAGHRLYERPSLEFVPFIYTPLYYYVCGALSAVFGPSLTLLRVVSLASTCLTAALVYGQIEHETRDRHAAWLAAASYIATYRLCDYWFDIGRVDAFCMLWLMLAIHQTKCQVGRASAIVAGLALSLAFFSKQVAIAAALPLAGYLLLADRPRALAFGATLTCVTVGGFYALDGYYSGWFSYYTVQLPAAHGIDWDRLSLLWRDDLRRLAPTGLLLILAAGYGLRLVELRRFYAPLAITLFAVAWSARAHDGGHKNVIIPALLAVALLFGLALHAWQTAARSVPRSASLLLAALQFAALLFDPRQQLPSAEDRRIGEDFIARLRALPGDVYVVDHGHYAALAGKRTFAQGMAVGDVARGDLGPVGRALTAEIARAIQARRFSAVVVGTTVPLQLDARDPAWTRGIHSRFAPPGFADTLERNYAASTLLYGDTLAFTPRVGWRRRPCVIYAARQP